MFDRDKQLDLSVPREQRFVYRDVGLLTPLAQAFLEKTFKEFQAWLEMTYSGKELARGVVKYVSLTPEEQTFLKTCWTLKSWLKKLGLLLIVFAVKQFLRFAGARGVGYYAVGARPVGALRPRTIP